MIILEKKKGWKVTSLSWKLFNNKLEAEKTKSKENRTVGAKMYETETNTHTNQQCREMGLKDQQSRQTSGENERRQKIPSGIKRGA